MKLALVLLFIMNSVMATAEELNAKSLPPLGTAITWFEFHVRDLDKSFAFYSQVFGWTCINESMGNVKACIIVKEGYQIGEVIEKPSAPLESPVLLYLSVDAVKPVYEKAIELGATAVYPPMNIPFGLKGSLAVFKDPNGIQMGVNSKNLLE